MRTSNRHRPISPKTPPPRNKPKRTLRVRSPVRIGGAQVERYRTLVEQGVVAREQYEQLRTDYDTLKANSEAARAAVRSADETMKVDRAAIDTAKVQLSYCYIHSPIDGRAGQRLVDLGNVVNPGGPGNAENGVSSNALLVIER